jgi:outer membrane protein
LTQGNSRTTHRRYPAGCQRCRSRNYSIELRQSIYDDANYGRLARARAELLVAEAQYAEAWQNFLYCGSASATSMC